MFNINKQLHHIFLTFVGLCMIGCSTYKTIDGGAYYGVTPIGEQSQLEVFNDTKPNNTQVASSVKPINKNVEVVKEEIAQEGILPPKVYDPELETAREIEKAQKKEVLTPAQKAKANFDLKFSKKHFKSYTKFYMTKNKERFQRQIKRGLKYKEIIGSIFEEHELPTELFFVGLIESGYSTKIRSHAGAVGPWQFIKGTATRYGLKVDRRVDERYHIIKSTHAAASYFKDLYNIFGSWELALCAYNAGEYRIINAIRRGNTRDYVTLVKKKLIPRETAMYIPKVAAAMYLFQNNKDFQFDVPRDQTFDNAKFVAINKSFSVKKLVRKFKLSAKQTRALNPDIKKDWIKSTRRSPFRLTVDRNVNINKLSSFFKNQKRNVAAQRSSSRRYRVKRGDTLIGISKKFGVKLSDLKRANSKRGSRIYIGQKLKIPSNSSVYVVRRGDNLTTIAKKFGTTVRVILSLNDMRRSRIYPKQKLIVPTES